MKRFFATRSAVSYIKSEKEDELYPLIYNSFINRLRENFNFLVDPNIHFSGWDTKAIFQNEKVNAALKKEFYIALIGHDGALKKNKLSKIQLSMFESCKIGWSIADQLTTAFLKSPPEYDISNGLPKPRYPQQFSQNFRLNFWNNIKNCSGGFEELTVATKYLETLISQKFTKKMNHNDVIDIAINDINLQRDLAQDEKRKMESTIGNLVKVSHF